MQHSLEEFLAPDKFKSYEQLKERLDKVLGTVQATTTADEELITESETIRTPVVESKPKVEMPVSNVETTTDDDEDDSLSYFQKLANED